MWKYGYFEREERQFALSGNYNYRFKLIEHVKTDIYELSQDYKAYNELK
jgi:hypothetical protein